MSKRENVDFYTATIIFVVLWALSIRARSIVPVRETQGEADDAEDTESTAGFTPAGCTSPTANLKSALSDRAT